MKVIKLDVAPAKAKPREKIRIVSTVLYTVDL